MYLNPTHFNRFLNKMGQDVLWRQAVACPCRNQHSGAASLNCPVCRGKGFSWQDPVPALVALTGQKVNQEWAKFGMWENGDVVVSIPSDSPCYRLADFDRVVFTDSTEPFSFTRVRGREPALMLDIASLDGVYLIQDGDLVLTDTPTLVDGVPTWPDGEGPTTGQQYTIMGRKHPEYYVFQDFPQDRAHHHGRDLPRRVVLRKIDLLGREAA